MARVRNPQAERTAVTVSAEGRRAVESIVVSMGMLVNRRLSFDAGLIAAAPLLRQIVLDEIGATNRELVQSGVTAHAPVD